MQATIVLAGMERAITQTMADGRTRIEAMRAHNRLAHLAALRASLEPGK
ncbi:hypothetical protein [Ramlibacter sp. Leaf400]|nr:hypothetical protein [Ramlibacter sp. Leaf400]